MWVRPESSLSWGNIAFRSQMDMAQADLGNDRTGWVAVTGIPPEIGMMTLFGPVLESLDQLVAKLDLDRIGRIELPYENVMYFNAIHAAGGYLFGRVAINERLPAPLGDGPGLVVCKGRQRGWGLAYRLFGDFALFTRSRGFDAHHELQGFEGTDGDHF